VNSDDIDDMEDSELQTRLEKTEARAKKMEELQEKAENDLKQIREMADKEQKSFHRKLEEAEAEKAAYQKDTQAKITDLTIVLANITVDKTKVSNSPLQSHIHIQSLYLSIQQHTSNRYYFTVVGCM
jgi:hypothetical protein